MKLMCIDDSSTIRMLVKKTLEPEGYSIIEAGNGREALEKVEKDISLFMVDVNMPVMDGFGFVRELRKDASMTAKPIVFLTTESSSDKKAIGKELGVSGWIVKPFEPESLKKVVKMLV